MATRTDSMASLLSSDFSSVSKVAAAPGTFIFNAGNKKEGIRPP